MIAAFAIGIAWIDEEDWICEKGSFPTERNWLNVVCISTVRIGNFSIYPVCEFAEYPYPGTLRLIIMRNENLTSVLSPKHISISRLPSVLRPAHKFETACWNTNSVSPYWARSELFCCSCSLQALLRVRLPHSTNPLARIVALLALILRFLSCCSAICLHPKTPH